MSDTVARFKALSRRSYALLFIGCFGIIGVLAIFYTTATTPTASVESEAGAINGNANIVTSTGTSGGSAVKFGTAAAPSGTWPSGWDDPRFANNVSSGPKVNQGSTMVTWQNLTVNDQSGQPSFGYGNYTLKNTRIRSREGPRISGSNILIEDTYIEVAGTGSDHGDGIQAFECTDVDPDCKNTNFTNVVVRRTNIVLPGGALNAGIFLADHSGVDLTLQDVRVDGGPAPNGALFFANSSNGSDKGCHSLRFNHVRVKPSVRFEGLSSCSILEWTDVAYENGTPIPRPN